jgi:sulfate adenylyltransferase subunit 1 (EFTu-like GTPase family)
MESLIGSTQRMVKGTATALQQRLTIDTGKRLIAETKKHALLSSIVAPRQACRLLVFQAPLTPQTVG